MKTKPSTPLLNLLFRHLLVGQLMKAIPILFIWLFGCTHALAAQSDVNEDWVRRDSIFIDSIKNAYAKNPIDVVDILKPDQNRATQLGYGYSIIAGSRGEGYVSTFYRLVYKNKALAGYMLEQQMPSDSSLIERYKKMFAGFFEIDGNKTMPKYYNYRQMALPLDGYVPSDHSFEELDFYMTPYSGVVYGDRGGYANTLIENRRYYMMLKTKLTPTLYEYLLYSKNPATRLAAIEYFQAQKNVTARVRERIENILSELPEVETMSGCLLHLDSARKLVEEYGNKHASQTDREGQEWNR